ncbi:MAG: hypothetical protein KAS32_25540 [Candidatus Peribacteraceae bacterium]|nr:hypothetical protein [Candidatus Peribacteraceae bacterium]
MKIRLVLSVDGSIRFNDVIAIAVTSVCAECSIPVNVIPLYSSVEKDGRYVVERGCEITILSCELPTRIIELFERLQARLGIGCVWLEYTNDPTSKVWSYNYIGCILEWIEYKEHRDQHGLENLKCCKT